MKAITIKQPWASLIVEGIKDIENRTWKTNFRGRVLIHAGAKEDIRWFDKCSEITASFAHNIIEKSYTKEEYYKTFGCIIGSVEIIDCVINHPSIWAEKTEVIDDIEIPYLPCYGKKIYNWALANHIKFKNPIPMKGKLSFWESECEILKCPECGNYCLHNNHAVGVPNWGNPVHKCEHCGYMILESEFDI